MLSRLLFSSVFLLALAGCSMPSHQPVAAAPVCAFGSAMAQTTLYFGLNRPQGGIITDAEFQAFIDGEATPRFKDGLTVFAAKGQWSGDDGKLTRENSRALMLIYRADNSSARGIEALRAIYQQRFSQESVMRIDTPVCVAF